MIPRTFLLIAAPLAPLLLVGAMMVRTPIPPSRVPEPPPSQADGAELYNQRCMACHMTDGGGVPGVFPPLAGVSWVTGDAGTLLRIILHGVAGPLEVAGMTYAGAMPAWGAVMTDEEIAAVATYIRSNWGNDAPAVTPADVAAVREATTGRTAPWSAAELQALQDGAGD